MQIPEYIERRIRRAIPSDSFVISGSTPVVSFGDARSAAVATLGLNPSRVEFLDHKGNELIGQMRRLATHRSLKTCDLTNAPRNIISQVLTDCDLYFERNPYRRWFDQLELVLTKCGASYYDRSACHLDLVQWATNPTWGRLNPAALRRQLIENDAPFLEEQLSNENIQTLLLNGMGVIRALQRVLKTTLDELDPIAEIGFQKTRLFTGNLFGRVAVIGWSTNLQSSFDVSNELRVRIAERVGALADVVAG